MCRTVDYVNLNAVGLIKVPIASTTKPNSSNQHLANILLLQIYWILFVYDYFTSPLTAVCLPLQRTHFTQPLWGCLGFIRGASGKETAHQCRRYETQVWSLGWEDPLEKDMATDSSILVWRTPWTEEPSKLKSMGSQSWTQLKWQPM